MVSEADGATRSPLGRGAWRYVCVASVAALIIGISIGLLYHRVVLRWWRGGDIFNHERPADVAHPRQLVRHGFQLSFPGNWTVDTSDVDYDPDNYLTLESLGAAFITILILDFPTDPQENVQVNVEEFVPTVLKNPERSTFTKWGSFEGYGVELRGKLLALVSGGVRIFSSASAARSLIVTESYHDDDREMVEPGFRLIRSTFSLTDAAVDSAQRLPIAPDR